MRITQYSNQGVAKPPLIQEPIKFREQQAGLESHACVHKGRFPENSDGSFGTIRKRERIHQNLLMAKAFVKLQVESLKEVESTLILWANNLQASSVNSAVNSLFLQPVIRQTRLRYNDIPLYGNGTESPLKIYYQKDGQRALLEVPVLPLLCEPAFSKIPFACKTGDSITASILHASCGEVMGNHVIAESKLHQVEDLIDSLYPLNQIPKRASLLVFLQRLFKQPGDCSRDLTSFAGRSSNGHIPYKSRGEIIE